MFPREIFADYTIICTVSTTKANCIVGKRQRHSSLERQKSVAVALWRVYECLVGEKATTRSKIHNRATSCRSEIALFFIAAS